MRNKTGAKIRSSSTRGRAVRARSYDRTSSANCLSHHPRRAGPSPGCTSLAEDGGPA